MPEEEVQPLTDDERAEALRRFSTRRIHPCEVTGQEVVGGPMVLCPRPGLIVTPPARLAHDPEAEQPSEYPLCHCGKPSLAAMVEHICQQCADAYRLCPWCANPELSVGPVQR